MDEICPRCSATADACACSWQQLWDHIESQDARIKTLEELRDGLMSATERLDAETFQLRARIKEADDLILAAYVSGHRDGWEPGPSVDETMHRLLCYLDNHGLAERKERALAGKGETIRPPTDAEWKDLEEGLQKENARKEKP